MTRQLKEKGIPARGGEVCSKNIISYSDAQSGGIHRRRKKKTGGGEKRGGPSVEEERIKDVSGW